MRVRDLEQLIARIDKLADTGYNVKVISVHFDIEEMKKALNKARRDFKRARYGVLIRQA